MKSAVKRENDLFLVITLKPLSGLMVIVNRPRTTKLWVIARENGNKARKQRIFGHLTQTCIGSYGRCKIGMKPQKCGQ